ncbi:hypothetical protein Tco_0395766, partial [Tanacetum coccineum]
LNVNHSDKEAPVEVSANVLNNSHDGGKETSSKYVQRKVVKNGGSVLDIMEDMIRGSMKDFEHIIGSQGVGDVLK